VETLNLASRYGTIQIVGRLDQTPVAIVSELRGTVTPQWDAVDGFLARAAEPGTLLRGQKVAFGVRGPLTGENLGAVMNGLHAELAVDGLQAAGRGVRVAPTKLAVHFDKGQFTIDPIDATVNGGRAQLRPAFVIDERGLATFSLAPGSSIVGAEINDKVARSLLSYAAPIFEKANRVNGHVSVHVDRLEIPLAFPEIYLKTAVAGRMELRDVVCSAGPLAADIFKITGRAPRAFRLDQSVEVTVANGRVYQRGLAVPLGPDARIDLDGSVGFDQTLALRARLIADRGMVRGRNELGELFDTLRLGVPIGGTLAKPAIDRRVLEVGLRDLGTKLLNRSGNRDAAEILKQLVRPDNPGAPQRR
jgi:translocation and assembly module TamB